MRKIGTIVLLIALSLVSCNQEADKVKKAEEEVLAIHDEVMPKMEDIINLKKELTDKMIQLDSLQQEGISSNTLAQQRVRAFELSHQLSKADSLMMEWMYRFRGDSAKVLAPKDALDYFKKEKDKIDRVKEETNKSIQEAIDFLKQ